MRWIAALYASLRTVMITALATSGAAQAQQPSDPDDATWEAARRANTTEALQGYLEQFPVGRHVEEKLRALLRINQVHLNVEVISRLTHAPHEDRPHVQLAAHLLRVYVFALESKSRGACDHFQPLELRQAVN